jgi:hypothetical protein
VWLHALAQVVAYLGEMGIKAQLRLRWNNARARSAQRTERRMLAAVALLEEHDELMRLPAKWAAARSIADSKNRWSP